MTKPFAPPKNQLRAAASSRTLFWPASDREMGGKRSFAALLFCEPSHGEPLQRHTHPMRQRS